MGDNRQLISGAPVPEDGSHKIKDRGNGMQRDYIVLSPEERAKGFVKPVRLKYLHSKCGAVTTMHSALGETYARNPYFYSGTYCANCMDHFDLEQFTWEPDGEPMDPLKQADWAVGQAARDEEQRTQRRASLQSVIQRRRTELQELETQLADLGGG